MRKIVHLKRSVKYDTGNVLQTLTRQMYWNNFTVLPLLLWQAQSTFDCQAGNFPTFVMEVFLCFSNLLVFAHNISKTTQTIYTQHPWDPPHRYRAPLFAIWVPKNFSVPAENTRKRHCSLFDAADLAGVECSVFCETCCLLWIIGSLFCLLKFLPEKKNCKNWKINISFKVLKRNCGNVTDALSIGCVVAVFFSRL